MASTDVTKGREKEKKAKEYTIDLDKTPNGHRKPLEACIFINRMKTWREESARSTVLIR